MVTNIDLSVVTGTYNRLGHLQDMIESVRASIGVGILYEIVLVDGGSTDGTIEWAKDQQDVVLIEQGELLGAIRAFNPGLFAAQGRYCVVGNDDIVYEDESLVRALAFMEDNPDVGVGCFYQDRGHPGQYDLSYMPAVIDHRQMQHLYGQVCIVPKWLGDKVGWWGDFPDMRTYGGDNNLSCFVLELGYRVTGIECACIQDREAKDDLRKINNEQQIATRKNYGGHPDSVAWGRHWTHRDGTCGAIVNTVPQVDTPIKRDMRFLYLPIYEQGHAVQLEQKHGLRDALANYGMVYEIDWQSVTTGHGSVYMLAYLMDAIEFWKPDILLTQIHTPDDKLFCANNISQIRREFPDLIWANWNGDYHPEDLLSKPSTDMAKLFDVQCVVTTAVRNAYAKAGVSWMYWQIGYEESDVMPDANTPRHDIVFLASGYSRDRIRLAKRLQASKYDVGIYGSWGSGIQTNGSNLYNFADGQKLYQNAKIAIGDNQWGDRAVGFVSNRLFQAMAAGGALLLHQYVPDLGKLLGLHDEEHYIVWYHEDDLIEKLEYWLDQSNEIERQSIADNGTAFIRESHSFNARVKELMEVLMP